MDKASVEWTLESWASGIGLTESSVTKLTEQEITSVDTLVALEEVDIKELNLNVGQRALLRKSLQQFRSPIDQPPAELDIPLNDPLAGPSTTSFAKDKELKEVLASMKSDLLPGILAMGENSSKEYKYDRGEFSSRSARHKVRRIPDFITEDLDVHDDDEEEVATVSGGKLVMRRDSKPKVSDITLPEWISANARILIDMIEKKEVRSLDDVKLYMDYTVKIGDYCRENQIPSVMRFDDKFRREREKKDWQWDKNDAFLMHNNLTKRDTKYGQRNSGSNSTSAPYSSSFASNRSQGKPRAQAMDSVGKVICEKYQSARGCNWQGCIFSHVCIIPGCGGPHPSSQHNTLSTTQLRPQAAPFMPPTHQYSGFHGPSH